MHSNPFWVGQLAENTKEKKSWIKRWLSPKHNLFKQFLDKNSDAFFIHIHFVFMYLWLLCKVPIIKIAMLTLITNPYGDFYGTQPQRPSWGRPPCSTLLCKMWLLSRICFSTKHSDAFTCRPQICIWKSPTLEEEQVSSSCMLRQMANRVELKAKKDS